jgi:hypothetical protein
MMVISVLFITILEIPLYFSVGVANGKDPSTIIYLDTYGM